MGKGEIACYEQLLLFPQCFEKTCTADMLKPGLLLERVKSLPNNKLKAFADNKINVIEKLNISFGVRVKDIVEKGENTG